MYPDGRVCISILHTPGEDPLGYESATERWSPVQSIEKILLSVVSMLAGKTQDFNLDQKQLTCGFFSVFFSKSQMMRVELMWMPQ